MQLIETLQKDHIKLIRLLESLAQKPLTQTETQKELFEAREILENHLKKEDDEFYPLLKYEALRNPDLKRILSVFAQDMQEISIQAAHFFKTYQKGSDGLGFHRDAGRLLALLKIRIRKEESILYPWLAQAQRA